MGTMTRLPGLRRISGLTRGASGGYLLSDNFAGSALDVSKWPTKVDSTSQIAVDTGSLHFLAGKVGGAVDGDPGVFSRAFAARAGMTLQARLSGPYNYDYYPCLGFSNTNACTSPATQNVYRMLLVGDSNGTLRCGVGGTNHDFAGLWTAGSWKWVRMVLTATGATFWHSNDGQTWTLLYTDATGWPATVYAYLMNYNQIDGRVTGVRLR